jgi:hypothetical protein
MLQWQVKISNLREAFLECGLLSLLAAALESASEARLLPTPLLPTFVVGSEAIARMGMQST